MIDTVLMDLDGTLLPFEQDDFINAYFQLLCRKLCPLGYDKEAVIKGIWNGTKAMLGNDGSKRNAERFWDGFAAVLSDSVRSTESMLDRFYSEEFHEVRQILKGDSPAGRIVQTLKDKGYTVVLATNPLFPRSGQLTRMSWIGLHETDFDMITSYETESACKPNPMYYSEICRKLNVNPVNCLMIGNDVREDMKTAYSLGMKCFLVTDCMIPCDDYEWNGPRGTFRELIEFLK